LVAGVWGASALRLLGMTVGGLRLLGMTVWVWVLWFSSAARRRRRGRVRSNCGAGGC
jgi:hypothetical protein